MKKGNLIIKFNIQFPQRIGETHRNSIISALAGSATVAHWITEEIKILRLTQPVTVLYLKFKTRIILKLT